MVSKVKKVKGKKEQSWDEIGATIGKKVEKEFKKEKNSCSFWEKSFESCHHEGGGIGRLIFALGVLFAMGYLGWLVAIPYWVLVVIVIGFTFMKL